MKTSLDCPCWDILVKYLCLDIVGVSVNIPAWTLWVYVPIPIHFSQESQNNVGVVTPMKHGAHGIYTSSGKGMGDSIPTKYGT